MRHGGGASSTTPSSSSLVVVVVPASRGVAASIICTALVAAATCRCSPWMAAATAGVAAVASGSGRPGMPPIPPRQRRQTTAAFVVARDDDRRRRRRHRHRSVEDVVVVAPPSSSSRDHHRDRPLPLPAAWRDDGGDDILDSSLGGPPPTASSSHRPAEDVVAEDEQRLDDDDRFFFFDESHFDAFERAIESVAKKGNVVRDFRKNADDLAVAKAHLLDRRRRLSRWDVMRFLPPPPPPSSSSTFSPTAAGTANAAETAAAAAAAATGDHREEEEEVENANKEAHTTSYAKRKMRERGQAFLDETGLTQSQHRLATVFLAHLADDCAKNSDPGPMHVAWEKILEAGLVPLSRTLSTYLYVLGLEGGDVGDGGVGGDGVDRPAAPGRRDVAAEVAMLHDALYLPTEKTITLLVKSLVSRGDARGAEALLDGITPDGPLGQLLRHRTTSPILRLYCENGDIDSALRLYRRMRSTSRVKMDASTYADFVAAVARNGYFRYDSECVPCAESLGYGASCGPALMDELVSEMAEDVLDISEESARALRDGFAMGFGTSTTTPPSGPGIGMAPLATKVGDRTLVAGRVAVDAETAICPATGATLRFMILDKAQRVHVHDTLLEMARSKSMEYTARLAAKGRSTADNAEKAEQATQILREFSEWMDKREGPPYTAIVDGANVAYFGWGRVNVYQLVHMVNALERLGEHPLVVFPQKYTNQRFHLRQGMMQVLRHEELEYLERLREKGQMYVVPPMCLDDLCECPFWQMFRAPDIADPPSSSHNQRTKPCDSKNHPPHHTTPPPATQRRLDAGERLESNDVDRRPQHRRPSRRPRRTIPRPASDGDIERQDARSQDGSARGTRLPTVVHKPHRELQLHGIRREFHGGANDNLPRGGPVQRRDTGECVSRC